MRVPIRVPNLGTDRGVLSVWRARRGERVTTYDRVVEVLIPGATFDMTAPADGVLDTQFVATGERLVENQILGEILTEDEPCQ